MAEVAREELVHVEVAVVGYEERAVELPWGEERDTRDRLGGLEELETEPARRDGRRRRAARAPERLAEEGHDARRGEEPVLGEPDGRLAQEGRAQDLEPLKGAHGVELVQRRGAPSRRVVARLGLALEEEHVGEPTLGEEVGERGPCDATPHDRDLVAAAGRRRVCHPLRAHSAIALRRPALTVSGAKELATELRARRA